MTAERVEIIRSTRRRGTVSAVRAGDRTIVRVPAGMSAAEERRHVRELLGRLAARESRRAPSDATLAARIDLLRQRHLPEAPAPASVRWVSNQHGRWGSCSPATAAIRISDRLAALPGWVLDYVLVHEVAHLVVAGHDARFWALVQRYPQATRARGFLEGYAAAGSSPAGGLHAEDAD